MPTKRQIANRANAETSTGPRTRSGKARSARNAERHGVLSTHLVIEGEDAAEYEQLFSALVADLQPVGALEMIFVERIAVAVWRQRRLVRAESAAIRFRQAADDTKKMLLDTLGKPGFYDTVRQPHALEPLSENDLLHLGSLRQIKAEFAKLRAPDTLAALAEVAPVFYDMLRQEAEASGVLLPVHVRAQSGLPEERTAEAIALLVEKHRPRVEADAAMLQSRLQVSTMRDAFHETKLIPPEAEPFARYQTSLDNTLNKALRAFYEARERRLALIQPAE